jgi:hypothetical protein
MHIYRLPKRFAEDHWERELVFKGDWVVHETKQHVFVRLSEEGAHDMLSDADYYSEPGMGWAEGLEGIRASARYTLKAMQQQMQQIEETGSTPWDSKYQVVPEYCMDCGTDITCLTLYAGGRCYPCHHKYWRERWQAARLQKADK